MNEEKIKEGQDELAHSLVPDALAELITSESHICSVNSSIGLVKAIEEVLPYARLGIAVFPVNGINDDGRCTCGNADCSRAGKHPILKGWQSIATADQAQIMNWRETYKNCNFGIICGTYGDRRLVVIDLDADKGGFDSLRELEQAVGVLPDTVTVLTGGGGMHMYYYVPNDIDIPNAVEVGGYQGIDIKSRGGYVVSAGSVHRSGRRYEWDLEHRPADIEIAALPNPFIKFFSKKPKNNPLHLVHEGSRSGESEFRFTERIADKTRNNTLFLLASQLHHRGSDRESVLDTITRVNQTNCDPPLTEDEIERLVVSATSYPVMDKKRIALARERERIESLLETAEPDDVSKSSTVSCEERVGISPISDSEIKMEEEITTTKNTRVGEVWKDVDKDYQEIELPSGYTYTETSVAGVSYGKDGEPTIKVVCNQPTFVAGWRKDVITGDITAVIATKTPDCGWAEVPTPPSTFTEARKTGMLRDLGLSIVDPKIMAIYLNSSYEQTRVLSKIPPVIASARCGWHPQKDGRVVFVLPTENINHDRRSRVVLQTPNKATLHMLVNSFDRRGSQTSECEMLLSALKDWPKLAFALGVAASAPLMRIAREDGVHELTGIIVEYVSGGAGRGKTTTASYAYSPWGSPSTIRMLHGTPHGIIQRQIASSDLPVIYQEAQAIQGEKSNTLLAQELVHAFSDNGDKIQGAKEGGVRAPGTVYGTLILASNDTLLPDDARQGAEHRVITLQSPVPFLEKNKDKIESMLQTLARNHGNGGPAMIAGLLNRCEFVWEKLQDQLQEDWREERKLIRIPDDLEYSVKSGLQRRSNYISLIRLGLKYLLMLGYGLTESEYMEYAKGIDEVWEDIVSNILKSLHERIEWQKYLDNVKRWILAQSARFEGMEPPDASGKPAYPHGGYIGRVIALDGVMHIAVNPDELSKFLKIEHNKKMSTLYDEWLENDIISPDKDGSVKRTVKFQMEAQKTKASVRMVCFRCDKLDIEPRPAKEKKKI